MEYSQTREYGGNRRDKLGQKKNRASKGNSLSEEHKGRGRSSQQRKASEQRATHFLESVEGYKLGQ